MSEKNTRTRRTFDDDFKISAVDLMVKQGYSFQAAADAVNVPIRSLRNWHAKFAATENTDEQKTNVDALKEENRKLRKQLLQSGMEREILKKATAYFAKESQ